MSKDKTIGNIAAFLFIFNMYGYPLQIFIPFILQINSTPINIGIRSAIVFTSLLLIGYALPRRYNEQYSGFIWMILFWIIYSIKLIYNIEIENVHFLQENSFYVYSFAFGACLIPAIAVYLNSKYINLKNCIKLAFWVLLLSNLSLFYSILSSNNWNLVQVFAERGNVNVDINFESISIVNPITISFYGQLLALFSIFFIKLKIFKKSSSNIFLISTCFLGMLNLLMGASRGPTLTFLVLYIIIYLTIKTQIKIASAKAFKRLFIVGLILFVVLFVFFQNFKLEELKIFSRLTESYQDSVAGNNIDIREYQWESAIEQFVDSPLIGDKFVNNFDSSYAHNLILDVLMSVGFLGLIPYLMMFVHLTHKIKYSISRIKENPYFFFFAILLFAEFLLGQTSGGTFVAINFWLLTAFLLGYPTKLVKRLDNN